MNAAVQKIRYVTLNNIFKAFTAQNSLKIVLLLLSKNNL